MRSGLIFFLYLSLSIFLKVASSLLTEMFHSAVVQLPRHSNSLQHNKECYVPYYAAHHDSLSITNSQSLLKFRCNKLVVPSDHLIVVRRFFCTQAFPASGSFPIVSSWHRWRKYRSFSFSKSTSNEYSGLVSIRIDCVDLLAVQGTCKSLLKHHSSKSSIIPCTTSCLVHLSHPYMSNGNYIGMI